MFSEEDIKDGNKYSSLGPAYLASRRWCEGFMSGFREEHFEPLLKDFLERFRNQFWDDVATFLKANTMSHIHDKMWQFVDDMVEHILAGDEWAIKKYALDDRFRCRRVRKALVDAFPEELKDERIRDLEKEIADLKRHMHGL